MVGNDPAVNMITFENVRVYRKGKMNDVLAAMERTTEDLIEEEAEKSRKLREIEEKKGGRLKRPDVAAQDYHPRIKPE